MTLLTVLGSTVGCKEQGEAKHDKYDTSASTKVFSNVVTTKKVETTEFHMEIVSNGKVEAKNILGLAFEQSGIISDVYVNNGDHVSKGQILAKLNQAETRSAIEKAKLNCEESELQLRDFLIGQGYSYEKKDDIPENIMRIALIKSGYLRSQKELEISRRQIEKATLRAPFDGVIANLKARKGSMAGSEPVCDIISRKDMEVSFPVLQNEVEVIKRGTAINIRSFSDNEKTLSGKVLSINPIVDDNGQIMVRASVEPDARLITGMNVRILIHKNIAGQIVVPKTAVVERSGRKVVFSVEDGKACWHYVNIGLQNTGQYTVADGLEPGMEIVTSGAQNLSDGIPVKIQN